MAVKRNGCLIQYVDYVFLWYTCGTFAGYLPIKLPSTLNDTGLAWKSDLVHNLSKDKIY